MKQSLLLLLNLLRLLPLLLHSCLQIQKRPLEIDRLLPGRGSPVGHALRPLVVVGYGQLPLLPAVGLVMDYGLQRLDALALPVALVQLVFALDRGPAVDGVFFRFGGRQVFVSLEPLETRLVLGVDEAVLNNGNEDVDDHPRRSKANLRVADEGVEVQVEQTQDQVDAGEVSERVLQFVSVYHGVEVHGGERE